MRMQDAPGGVGCIPPLAEGRPERRTTCTRSVQRPSQGPQNRYQDPATFAVAPRTAHRRTGGQSCLGRLPWPPENAKTAFRWGWYKLEMPQPLRRPTQTRRAPPAPASPIEAERCSLWLPSLSEGRPERHRTVARSVQSPPRLTQNGYQADTKTPPRSQWRPGRRGTLRPPDPVAEEDPVAATKMANSPS
jgi:hypothetical protein